MKMLFFEEGRFHWNLLDAEPAPDSYILYTQKVWIALQMFFCLFSFIISSLTLI